MKCFWGHSYTLFKVFGSTGHPCYAKGWICMGCHCRRIDIKANSPVTYAQEAIDWKNEHLLGPKKT
jgi:hypothetical protein